MEYVYHVNKWWWGTSIKMVSDDGNAFVEIQFDKDYPKTGVLSSLSVHEDYRRKGLGQKLLTDCENLCRHYGKENTLLDVEKGTWLKGWYKRNGYKVKSYNKHYYKMLKKL